MFRILTTASRLGVVLGLSIFLIEALCRADLSKHKTLIGIQFAISLLVVLAFAFKSRGDRDGSKATGAVLQTTTAAKQAPDVAATFLQRGAAYFQMASTAEFVMAAVLFICLIAITVLNLFHRKFDSDEPQHLHVIWEWTRGFIQYRDNFDNHMPLFHIAFAPIVGLIGERPNIIQCMRVVLFPMYFVALFATYRIGGRLFSRRVGVWAVLTVGFFSGYYPNAGDFRPNNVWSPLWLLCIAVLIGGAMNVRRALVAGLLLGFCFAISMKSTVFLFALLVAAILLLAINPAKIRELPRHLGHAVAFITTTAVVPLIIMVFFALRGLWPEFRYGVFDFNLLATTVYAPWLVYKSHTLLAIIIVAAVIPVVLIASKWIINASPARTAPRTGPRRAYVVLVCALYYMALQIFWTPISRTYPPIYPLIFVLCIGGLFELPAGGPVSSQRRIAFGYWPWAIALAEFALVLAAHPFLKNGTRKETQLLREVLTLTKPDDYILDAKGETIFRRRTFRPVFERITIKALQRGLIVDDAPRRCIDTRTCVVSSQIVPRLSKESQQFLKQNYVPITKNFLVAGRILDPANASPVYPPQAAPKATRARTAPRTFNVAIPAMYAMTSPSGQVSGTLDGTPYTAPRLLDVGQHSFEGGNASGPLMLIWSQAIDRGFKPSF